MFLSVFIIHCAQTYRSSHGPFVRSSAELQDQVQQDAMHWDVPPISKQRLMQHLNYLANICTSSHHATADIQVQIQQYVSELFRHYHVKPLLPHLDYTFPIPDTEEWIIQQADLRIHGLLHNGLTHASKYCTYGEDYIHWAGKQSLQLDHSPIIYIQHGVYDETVAWDDYKDDSGKSMDVRDAVVLMNPGFPSAYLAKLHPGQTKPNRFVYAASKGAQLILLPNYHPNNPFDPSLTEEMKESPIPIFKITPDVFDQLFHNTQYPAANRLSHALDTKKSLSFRWITHPMPSSMQVLAGYIPSDPTSQTSDEALVVSADVSQINSIALQGEFLPEVHQTLSGSAMLLTLMEVIAQQIQETQIYPKRPIAFFFFNGRFRTASTHRNHTTELFLDEWHRLYTYYSPSPDQAFNPMDIQACIHMGAISKSAESIEIAGAFSQPDLYTQIAPYSFEPGKIKIAALHPHSIPAAIESRGGYALSIQSAPNRLRISTKEDTLLRVYPDFYKATGTYILSVIQAISHLPCIHYTYSDSKDSCMQDSLFKEAEESIRYIYFSNATHIPTAEQIAEYVEKRIQFYCMPLPASYEEALLILDQLAHPSKNYAGSMQLANRSLLHHHGFSQDIVYIIPILKSSVIDLSVADTSQNKEWNSTALTLLKQHGAMIMEWDNPETLFQDDTQTLTPEAVAFLKRTENLGFVSSIGSFSEEQVLPFLQHQTQPFIYYLGSHQYLSEQTAQSIIDNHGIMLISIPDAQSEPNPTFMNMFSYLQYFPAYALGLVSSSGDVSASQGFALMDMVKEYAAHSKSESESSIPSSEQRFEEHTHELQMLRNLTYTNVLQIIVAGMK